MIRTINISMIYLVIITVTLLFIVKSKVQVLNKRILEIDNEIVSTQDNIHILKAELANLTKPSNIENLARQYLHLQEMKSDQLVSINLDRGSKVKIFEGTK